MNRRAMFTVPFALLLLAGAFLFLPRPSPDPPAAVETAPKPSHLDRCVGLALGMTAEAVMGVENPEFDLRSSDGADIMPTDWVRARLACRKSQALDDEGGK